MRAAIAVVLALAGSAAAAPVKISSRTRTVEIKDEAWGIVAFRMQIPEDWKFEGVLLRDGRCGGGPSVAYRLTSVDGISGLQVLPQFGWHFSDDATYLKAFRQFHCKVMQPISAADFLTYVVASIRPDPVVGKIEPTEDAQQFDAMIAQYNQRAAQSGLRSTETGGAVHAVIEYPFHGQQVEENLRVTLQTFDQVLGKVHNLASIAQVIGLRAPKGELAKVLAALTPLFQKAGMTPEWNQRFTKAIAEDSRRAFEDLKRRGEEAGARLKRSHDAYMKQSKESFERSQKVARDNADARHRANVAWTLYAGDEQLVRNRQTGQVTRVTTSSGTHGHQDSVSGDIVMTDDPNFDPSYYIQGSWTQLENVDP